MKTLIKKTSATTAIKVEYGIRKTNHLYFSITGNTYSTQYHRGEEKITVDGVNMWANQNFYHEKTT